MKVDDSADDPHFDEVVDDFQVVDDEVVVDDIVGNTLKIELIFLFIVLY